MNPRARRELLFYVGLYSRLPITPPRITSTDRNQSQQDVLVAAGRGVRVSKHVYGLAADIVPGAGWGSWGSLAALAANVRAWLPHVEAFPHGPRGRPADHVHIEWPWSF